MRIAFVLAAAFALSCTESSKGVSDAGPGDLGVPQDLDEGDVQTEDAPDVETPIDIDDGGDGVNEDADGSDATDGGDVEDVFVSGTPALVLNEVYVGDGEGNDDWIELFNAGDGTANLAGWSIGRPTGVKSVMPAANVAPGAYYIVEANLAFSLRHNDTIRLINPEGGVAGETTWTAGMAAPGSSWGRFPNGSGAFKSLATVTKAAANVDEGTLDCGDDTCDAPESCLNCPQDCGACSICGDGGCADTETCSSCFEDCGKCETCPDGVCSPDESCVSCDEDCGACPEGCSPTLFFGAYVEGASQDKALEIMNFTGEAVDLSAYAIWRITNGGSWTEGKSNDFPLTGILPHGQSLVLCNSSASPALKAVCDITGGAATSFNGDDALGLARNGVLVDAIGDDSPTVPSGGWAVGGVAKATTDHTLIRKSTVLQGNLEWSISAASEWEVLPIGNLGTLGSHVVNGNCEPPPVLPNVVLNELGTGEATFAEVINRDALNPVDLGGWSLEVGSTSYEFPMPSVVPPAGVLSVDGATLGAALEAGGAELVLKDTEGSVVDAVTPPAELLVDESYGRFPNGTGDFKPLDTPTPGQLNKDNVTLCGDGQCEGAETCSSCAKDCGACPKCGDGVCNGTDSCTTCPSDCGQCAECGDALCAQAEDCAGCSADCGECLLGCATDLLISEYVEALSSNKALEISNRTDKPVDLTHYAIWRITNGGAWATEGKGNAYALKGMLAPGKTLVICHSASDTPLLSKCDLTTGGMPTTFSGNDAVALVKDGIIIDVVGTEGADPGAGWEVGGVKAATTDHVLRRKLTVNAPNTDWDVSAANEWIVLPTAAFADDVGNHPLGAECTPLPPCGDGWCDPEGESCDACEADCGVCPETCGNDFCAETENCFVCEEDCGACEELCGDTFCVGTETCESCEGDCGACPEPCGNDQCLDGETCGSCPADCGACPAECSATLFFSEYLEGTNNNKALEIANNSGDPIDLTAYSIDVGFNGGAISPTGATPLTGTLANGAVLVLCHEKAVAGVLGHCDQTFAAAPLTFNGNDVVALYKGAVLVDVIGKPGASPAVGWDVAGVTAATADHRLIRKPTVSTGSVDWAVGVEQWSVESASVFDTLGAHTLEGPCVGAPVP